MQQSQSTKICTHEIFVTCNPRPVYIHFCMRCETVKYRIRENFATRLSTGFRENKYAYILYSRQNNIFMDQLSTEGGHACYKLTCCKCKWKIYPKTPLIALQRYAELTHHHGQWQCTALLKHVKHQGINQWCSGLTTAFTVYRKYKKHSETFRSLLALLAEASYGDHPPHWLAASRQSSCTRMQWPFHQSVSCSSQEAAILSQEYSHCRHAPPAVGTASCCG